MSEKKQSLAEIHKNLMKNPELPEKHHAHAFTHSGGMNWEEEPLLKVNERGFPVENVDKEAYASDYAGYWAIHAGKLWTVTGFCLLYLSFKLFGA